MQKIINLRMQKNNDNFESYIEKYSIILCVQTLRTPCISAVGVNVLLLD